MNARATIVPSERHVELGVRAWASPTTAVRFVDRWLSRAEPLLGRASRSFARLSVRRALAEPWARGAIPADPASLVRFAAGVERALGAAFEADLGPEDLRAADTPRMRLLADVAARFLDDARASGVVHPRAATSRLALAIERGFDVDLDLDVRGIFRPSASLCRLLSAIAARGHRVTIHLPQLAMDVDPLAEVATFLERFFGDAARAPEIAWEPLSPLPADVEVIEAAGPRAEARAIARTVLDLCNDGVALDDVAVVVPETDREAIRLAAEALAEARIPVSTPSRRDGPKIPELRTIHVLLDAASGAFSRDAIIELLTTRGVHFGAMTGHADEGDAARAAEATARAMAGLPVLRDRDGALMVAALEDRPRDGLVSPTILARLVEIVSQLRRADTRPRFAAALLRVVEALRLGVPSSGTLAFALGAEMGPELLSSLGGGALAIRGVTTAIEAWARAAHDLGLGDETVPLVELCEEARLFVAEAVSGADAGSRPGAVRIAPAREATVLPVAAIVVSGLTSRAYGALLERDAWFDDETIALLPRHRRPLTSRAAAGARLAEVAACLGHAGRASLTYSPRDDRGDEVSLAHDLVRLAEGRAQGVRREPPSRVAPAASVTTPRGAELVRLALGAPPGRDLRQRLEVDAARRAFFMSGSRPADEVTGLVAEDRRALLARRLGGESPERPVPVTALELYLQCPFKAFARNVLRAKRSDALDEALSPADRGSLLHRALQVGFEKRAALPPSMSRDETNARVRAAVADALGMDRPMSALRREAHRTALDDACAVVADEDLADPRWAFAWSERSFGARDAPPFDALRVWEGDPSLYVQGRIDRVDLSVDGREARIVDYKTGKPQSGFVERNVSLQLPLYGARILTATGRTAASVRYWFVGLKGKVDVRPRKDEDAALDDDRLAEAIARARDAQTGILRGEVAPRPAEARACARCDARDICRRPTVAAASEGEDRRRPDEGRAE